MSKSLINFQSLIDKIKLIHEEFSSRASKAINVSVTLRNWLVGFYIQEYEQNGDDRAQYGNQTLKKLEGKLPKSFGFSYRSLRLYRQFYQEYPEIWQSLIAILPKDQKGQSLITKLRDDYLPTLSIKEKSRTNIDPKLLIERLSFTHFSELIKIDDSLKRSFYEVECIKGGWSVRELKRQISSFLFERSALSKNKKTLSDHTQKRAEKNSTALTIKDPYIFEFLGIQSKDVMYESDLENSLLDKLQNFLLELGHGFCFEAKQKRILIGDEYFFVDLVFYHRVLKCHVLIELKTDSFKQEHIGQLNTYLNWYSANETKNNHDNPPVGILLCTEKNNPLVEYALAGMDNKLFVSKYQLELPKKEDVEKFIEEQLSEILPENDSTIQKNL